MSGVGVSEGAVTSLWRHHYAPPLRVAQYVRTRPLGVVFKALIARMSTVQN